MSKWGKLKEEAHKVGQEKVAQNLGQEWSLWWVDPWPSRGPGPGGTGKPSKGGWGTAAKRQQFLRDTQAALEEAGEWEAFCERLTFPGEGSDRAMKRYAVARKWDTNVEKQGTALDMIRLALDKFGEVLPHEIKHNSADDLFREGVTEEMLMDAFPMFLSAAPRCGQNRTLAGWKFGQMSSKKVFKLVGNLETFAK